MKRFKNNLYVTEYGESGAETFDDAAGFAKKE